MSTNFNNHKNIAFKGYYQTLVGIGSKVHNIPPQPNFSCALGDKGFLKIIPELLKQKNLKNDILITHKKTDSGETIVFELTQKAYNKLYSIFSKNKKIDVSDGKLETVSDYLKFIKPNSKIKSFVYEIPKHHMDFLHINQEIFNEGCQVSLVSKVFAYFDNKSFNKIINNALKSIKSFDEKLSGSIDKFFLETPDKVGSEFKYQKELESLTS